MKRSSRDLTKNPPVTTTPVNYRDANTVYRSLSAVPATLDVGRSAATNEKHFAKLVGPQTKGNGEVTWTIKQSDTSITEVQPCPIPLIVANAPHHSLFVESNPVSKVVKAVHDLFDQHHVDSVFNSAKFKWKCVCYDGDIETRFVSRLFSVPDKANFFVLDFQRRSGDPFHFQSIYRAINFRLLKSGFIVCNDSRADTKIEEPLFRTFKPLALPDSFEIEANEDAALAADLEPLCQMCTSSYVDVQREGLSALTAQLALNEAAKKALISFAGKLMEIVSLTRDAQVRRLATSAVAKLAGEKTVSELILARGGCRVLANFLVNSSEALETRRHCVSALLQIPQLDPQSKAVVLAASKVGEARFDQMLGNLQAKLATSS